MGRSAFFLVLVLLLASRPAQAGIEYYGYGNVSDPNGVRGFTSYTNFGQVGTGSDNPEDPHFTSVLDALTRNGQLLVLNIGAVLFDRDQGYQRLYPDWRERFERFMVANSDYLKPGLLLAIAIHDEPFWTSANMADFDTASGYVKSRLPWAKMWLVEAGIAVGNANWQRYTGTLPHVDWIGIDEYRRFPSDPQYQGHLATLKARFPGKKIIYVMDGWWTDEHAEAYSQGVDVLAAVAWDYYNVARRDPDAVLLGIFAWDHVSDGMNPASSRALPCTVRSAHARIGRVLLNRPTSPVGQVHGFRPGDYCMTGVAGYPGTTSECDAPIVEVCGAGGCFNNVQVSPNGVYSSAHGTLVHAFTWCPHMATLGAPLSTYAGNQNGTNKVLLPTRCRDNPTCTWYFDNHEPIGYLDGIDASGFAWGWTCDPDAPAVSTDVVFEVGITQLGPYRTNLGSEPDVNNLCGGGSLHRFRVQLPAWTRGQRVLAYGQDTMWGRSVLPGWQCPATTPACTW
jgi:hypothetical protein